MSSEGAGESRGVEVLGTPLPLLGSGEGGGMQKRKRRMRRAGVGGKYLT